MTATPPPTVWFVGSDASFEYLLGRYAQLSGCRVESLRGPTLNLDSRAPRPVSVWFSSLEVLAASQALRLQAGELDIPLVVCTSISDDARALELGADFIFLHPVTYDLFVSTLGRLHPTRGEASS